jgi:hypothetical protein
MLAEQGVHIERNGWHVLPFHQKKGVAPIQGPPELPERALSCYTVSG